MIEQFLQDEARAGRRCLLIVDESQNLEISAIEELRMLSNFQLGAHPLLQTLLLGQPEFREVLLDSPALEQLRQRVIATHHLEAMQPSEIQAYVEHRMNRAGWQGNPSFDEHLFVEIHAATGGMPRRVNQVVNRLLLLGAVEQRARIDGAMLAHVLSELNEDGTIAIVSPQPPKAVHAPVETAAPVLDMPAAAVDATTIKAAVEAAMAERDFQIQELQQAVVELANSVEEREEARKATHAELIAAIDEQVAAINARIGEQDRTIRHALTMIIEWIESGEGERAVA